MRFLPRRVQFYYDSKSCTYQRARLTKRWVGETLLTYGLFTAFAIFGFFKIYQTGFANSKISTLQSKQGNLDHQFADLGKSITLYETTLDELFQRENSLYAPIVEGLTIPEAVWEGGAGGTENYGKGGTSKIAETQIRIERLIFRIKLLKEHLKKIREKAEMKELFLSNMPSLLPVNGSMISGFGNRIHPVRGFTHLHTGIDFACPTGTPIYASGDGVVKEAGTPESGYGTQVEVDHENGYVTKYAHLSRLNVHVGQRVKRGDIVGFSGSTGLSTGPHLHYEIIHNGGKIDPLDYFYADLPPTSFLRELNSMHEANPMDLQSGQEN